jgi:hypothetical protein
MPSIARVHEIPGEHGRAMLADVIWLNLQPVCQDSCTWQRKEFGGDVGHHEERVVRIVTKLRRSGTVSDASALDPVDTIDQFHAGRRHAVRDAMSTVPSPVTPRPQICCRHVAFAGDVASGFVIALDSIVFHGYWQVSDMNIALNRSAAPGRTPARMLETAIPRDRKSSYFTAGRDR